jgi:ABC-type sugar transport system ATPase subunit
MSESVETPFVDASGLTKRFGSVRALRGASLRIASGTIEGLVGHNGAGKTTLISLLSGSQRPDAGEILLRGERYTGGGVVEAERKGVFLVPQRTSLFGDLSVLDNLMTPRRYPIRGRVMVGWREARAMARGALEEVGLDLDLDARVSSLSVPDHRALMIARALLRRPGLLILDEPTEAFAEAEVARLFDVLRGMVNKGMTVLYVSHRLAEVLTLASRVTVMREGETVATLEADGIDRRELVGAMLGDEATAPAAPSFVATAREGRASLLDLDGVAGDRLHGARLSVSAGEVVGLYGLAGSGSSEVLKTIAGLSPMHDGRIELKGRPLAGSVAARRRQGITYLSDAVGAEAALTGLTVRENVAIGVPGGVRRWPRIPIADRSSEADLAAASLDRVGLVGDRLGARIETLSGGMQQKVMLARTLVSKSSVWLLDEPLTGLDVHSRVEFSGLLRELVADGAEERCALLVLSDYEDLRIACDRVYAVRDGRIAAEFQSGQFTEHDLVHAVSFDAVA